METDTITPSVMRYSDQYPMSAPVMDLNYSVCIPSNGGSFTQNQEIRIPFNVPADCFVDTKRAYLKLRVTNNSAADTWYFDPFAGVAGLIDTFRVISGTGALLEEIQHYGALAAVMNSHQSPARVEAQGNIQEGLSPAPLSVEPVSVAAGVAGAQTDRVGLAHTKQATFTHRPISAIFNADKYMPFGYTQGSSYVSLTLAAGSTMAMCRSGAAVKTGAFTIDNVELHLPILRPGNEFAQNFRMPLASGMPINIHSVGFQNSQQTIASSAAAGAVTLTFSTRKRSVKSLMTLFRINAQVSAGINDSFSCRKTCGITEYQYSVGGVRVPSSLIKAAGIKSNSEATDADIGEVLANTQLALGHYSSDLRSLCADAKVYYMAAGAANDKVLSSRAVFALDLETYGEGLAGKNLSGQGLPLVLHAQTGANSAQEVGAILADLYVIHDIIFQLDGVSGTLTASS